MFPVWFPFTPTPKWPEKNHTRALQDDLGCQVPPRRESTSFVNFCGFPLNLQRVDGLGMPGSVPLKRQSKRPPKNAGLGSPSLRSRGNQDLSKTRPQSICQAGLIDWPLLDQLRTGKPLTQKSLLSSGICFGMAFCFSSVYRLNCIIISGIDLMGALQKQLAQLN